MKYNAWLYGLERIVEVKLDCSLEDFDYPYQIWFKDGLSVMQAFKRLLEEEGLTLHSRQETPLPYQTIHTHNGIKYRFL